MSDNLMPIVTEKEEDGDDSYFWEELLSEDGKDFLEEYLGQER